MTGNVFLSVFLLFTISFVKIRGNVIVNTSSGQVEGVELSSIIQNEKYYSFMGIPYAEPPVGPLRFMPPKPHPGWTGVLSAKKEKKPCAQFNLPVRHINDHGFCGDEDCLHLSVHTPKIDPDANYPVIVFIYSELHKISHNSSKDYGPDFFMNEGVIVVMVNHRLGSLGFLSFEDDLLPGNNALRDVILSLKWIKENIHNFGGDPYRVTLMGVQDGAGLVDVLLHSPKAKRLFSNVILQGGTSWASIYFPGKPRERAIEFSKVLEEDAKASTVLLRRLSTVSASKLTENEHMAVHADEARAVQRGIVAFGPEVEHDHPDAIISKLPEDGPIDIDVPVMIGYNSRDALEALGRYLYQPQYLTFADRDFVVLLPIRTGFYFKLRDNMYYHAMKEIKEHYFDEGYVKVSKPGEYITYMTDILTFYAVDYTVRKYTNESKSDVFYYTFDYSGELNMRKKHVLSEAKTIEGTWGATVGDDLCYLFVCKSIAKEYIKALNDEDSEDIKVLKNMVRMWSNFAKTGNPTPTGDEVSWKPATKENKECLVINEDPQIRTKLHDDRVTFWDTFIAKYKAMADNGVVKDIKDEL
ncbi:juvenile hormone esterase-like [Pectinophora gossypiella]|uniref:juvenile hormone esterase-like n=1 Tax=Pectinophora gossypiella TaxID=13191 RepID=UPI00214EA7AD|nr:juvenile hormone esterase-like [Pectinophora gossypiella]